MSIQSNHRILRSCILLLLALGIFAPVALQAQSAKGSTKVQFSCVSWKDLPFQNIFYRDGKKMRPLEIRPKNRSELYRPRQASMLELYIREMDENGDPSVKLVGQAAFPAGADRVLFLISEKATADGLPLTILGIDDSLKAFPPGSFRFVNSISSPIRVTLGEETKRVAPRSMTLVKFNGSSSGGFIPFYIKDTKGAVLYENRLFGTPSGRDMVFIGPPAFRGGRVSVALLPQIVAPDSSVGGPGI